MRHETAEAKPGRLIALELQRLNWTEPDLKDHPKSPPLKLAMGARLSRETTLTTRQPAWRSHVGSWKSLKHKLYLRNQTASNEPGKSEKLWFDPSPEVHGVSFAQIAGETRHICHVLPGGHLGCGSL